MFKFQKQIIMIVFGNLRISYKDKKTNKKDLTLKKLTNSVKKMNLKVYLQNALKKYEKTS